MAEDLRQRPFSDRLVASQQAIRVGNHVIERLELERASSGRQVLA
jgi:hypothetical protein